VLATAADYRRITGDNRTDDGAVRAALADAQGEVEQYLRRRGTLEDDGTDYTERLRVFVNDRGRVYPRRTPVTSVSVPSGARIVGDGFALEGVGVSEIVFFPGDVVTDAGNLTPYPYVADITYRGGYTAETVRPKTKRVICRVANAMVAPQCAVPAGAVSVRSGDVSVTYAKPQDPEAAIASILRELGPRPQRAVE